MISFQEQMQRWARVAGRPLNKLEQAMIARPFVYNSYWRSWSRLIKPIFPGHPMGLMELNLTPVSGKWGEDVKPMIVRNHSTAVDKDDRFITIEEFLETQEYARLVKEVGHEQAAFMCQIDLWPLIDIDKFVIVNRSNLRGGGVPFDSFRLVGTEGMPS